MKKINLILTVMGIALLQHTAAAQTFEMVKEINSLDNSFPGNFIEYDGKVYFSAKDIVENYELWVTDGTETGTMLFKDINVGAYASNPEDFIEYNNKLYFTADDGINGRELWVTDGTAAGTIMLKDINPSGSSSPSHFANSYPVEYDGKLYFDADDGTNGRELWVTDGTAAGTIMLKDINPSGDGDPLGFIEYDGNLYFRANDGSNGTELWVTDGTAAGTQMLKDINPSGDGVLLDEFAVYNDILYFIANDGTNGIELWVSDGTETGTVLFKDIKPGNGNSIPRYFTEYNGQLYFQANDTFNNNELWVTDGTELGTKMVKDIHDGPYGSVPRSLTVYNGKLYFIAAGAVINGRELWVTDGTDTGTTLLKDIYPVIGSAFASNIDYRFTEYNGKLYFSADDGTNGRELWETDGTAAGTQKISPATTPNNPLGGLVNEDFHRIVYNGSLYLAANYSSAGTELWKLSTIPLPVTWLSFDATAIADHTASLNWKTVAETNLSHFEVERSDDGKNFKAIGIVQSADNPAEENEYQFIDDNITHDVVYYRLKQVDIDERFFYSAIARVSFQTEGVVNNLSIVPNPGQGFISLQIADFSNQESIKVTDMNGRLVFHAAVSGSAVNIPAAPGIYVVSLLDEAGAVLESKKAIVE